MNAQVAALPDEKLIQPARAQLIDQLRTLVVLDAISISIGSRRFQSTPLREERQPCSVLHPLHAQFQSTPLRPDGHPNSPTYGHVKLPHLS